MAPMKQETSAERFTRLLNESRAKKFAAEAAAFAAPASKLPENQNVTRIIGNNNTGNSKLANQSPAVVATSKLAELRAKLAATGTITTPTPLPAPTHRDPEVVRDALNTLTNTIAGDFQAVGRTGEAITYNEEQLRFIQLASRGESCILIGAAGTGKTTCQRGSIQGMIQNGLLPPMDGTGHKYLPQTGTPGVVVCAYTRRATANIRRNMPEDLKNNCLTIHKLLEYEPVYYSVIDPDTGDEKTTMAFEPTRNAMNPLPSSIKCVVIEESSMVSVELYEELNAALPHKPQFIFLGDIQQLPPVFGSAILGYKMLELATVELTTVYRQALESPIIRLAHRILSGRAIPATEYPEWKTEGKLTLHAWKKKLHADTALLTAAKFFTNAIDHGVYDAEQDQILIPFNKSFGTDELNKHIAQHMSRQRGETVWEVIAGFNKHYFSVGDKVLVEKEDAVIISIEENPTYTGAKAQTESRTLDYWGYDEAAGRTEHHIKEVTDADVDFMLEAAAGADDADRVRKCSHVITVEMADSGTHVRIDAAADVNAMLLAYALTVHKSQGSEWRKVFLVLHQSHATMLQRELLYTAVTRAKEELYVICEPESFTKGIESQKIRGNTLLEKAEFFKGKVAANGNTR